MAPLRNTRIAVSLDEAVQSRGLLKCTAGDAHFSHLMREGVQMGSDFEVLSKD